MYCANCIVENDIRNVEQLFGGAAVTVLGGATLCLKCFWLKAERMKQQQVEQSGQVQALQEAVAALDELKKSL